MQFPFASVTLRELWPSAWRLDARKGGRKARARQSVIGLFNAWECSLSETAMAKGDTGALYGVTEAMDDSEEEFGETRLSDTISQNRALCAQLLAEAITAHVVSFSQDKHYDDITVVVVKVIP